MSAPGGPPGKRAAPQREGGGCEEAWARHRLSSPPSEKPLLWLFPHAALPWCAHAGCKGCPGEVRYVGEGEVGMAPSRAFPRGPTGKGRLLCSESPGPGDRSRVKECHRQRAYSSLLMVRVSGEVVQIQGLPMRIGKVRWIPLKTTSF